MMMERLAINQITTRAWSLEQAIAGYARQGISGIGLWRDKLAECGLIRARTLLRDAGMWVPSLCKAGDLARLASQGPQGALDDCKRAIEEAAEINAAAVVFVCGGMAPGQRNIGEARAKVLDVLHDARDFARQAGVSLAIEPFHPMHAAERGCVNTLAQAHRMREDVGVAASVVLDVFHTWWDPDLARFLGPPYVDFIATVQLCDWRVPTRHPVNDREMMGNGVADVAGIVHSLEKNGYRGPYEIEIFSDDWWSRDPDSVVRVCIERFMALEINGASQAADRDPP